MSSENTEVANSETEANDIQEDLSSPAPESSESEATPRSKKKGRGKTIAFVLFVLLVVCAGVAGWYFAKEQWLAEQADIASGLADQLAGLESEFAQLSEQLATQAQRQASIETAMIASTEESESQLLALAERLSESESTQSGDWELAEAEYLLRIANQRLVTSQDVNGAIEMMQAADRIITELAYPELTDARRQLVTDITRLSMVQPVDYEGIYFALDALLPLVAELSATNIERLRGEDSDGASGWDGYLAAVADAIRPYIVMSSADETEPQYLLSSEQESLIKSEIQLQIRQAQLAALASEPRLYQLALLGAAETVEERFVAGEKAASLAAKLREFSERSVETDSVDISASIRAVERVVDQMSRAEISNQPASVVEE